MAYSATDWRDQIAYYSGSTSGTRSWGALGQSQYQGRYYWNIYFNSITSAKVAEYYGCAGIVYGKIPQGLYLTNYASIYSIKFCGGNFSGQYSTGVYSIGHTLATGAFSVVLGVSYTNYSGGGYCATYYSQTAGSIAYLNPQTFTNNTPWGAPPYTAGSNVKIPANATAAKPYQRQVYTSISC